MRLQISNTEKKKKKKKNSLLVREQSREAAEEAKNYCRVSFADLIAELQISDYKDIAAINTLEVVMNFKMLGQV
ncbi:hypothetical protein L6164_037188 [Bauhinia variegata]|uniref:Uncharacterized protein n=1 Tax=Bauhinia variegata TaxID=167791 RepID=A0ACB9KJE1_BAUVA|nr:hypothetical protein L6164_037188 [Bauhinia variegata]